MESHGVSDKETERRGNGQMGQQNRQLSEACSKALAICEAAAKFPDTKARVSTEGYRKGDPQKSPNIAYVFTENAQAASVFYEDALGYDSEVDAQNPKVRINVSDVSGTNQAGIRTDSKGAKSPNAFGIVVKKVQQDANGRFLAKEGQFRDTDSDFAIFKAFNERFFQKLADSGLTEVLLPSQIALGKAALPLRFAEWLQGELRDKLGIRSTISKNNRADYDGYGLSLDTNTRSVPPILQHPQEQRRLHAAQEAGKNWTDHWKKAQSTIPVRENISSSDSANQVNRETQQTDAQKEFIANAELYSGAAKGADTVWGNAARKYGIKVKDFTVANWDDLSLYIEIDAGITISW